MTANSDRVNVPGVQEGVVGPVRAAQTGSDPTRGNVVSVNIGEGIPSSGTGAVGFAGIYADGIIDQVRGSGADIRGDIVASGRTTFTTNAAGQTTPSFIIGSVRLTGGGSIIDADIMNVDPGATDVNPADGSQEIISSIVIPQRPDPLTAPIFDIGSIRVDGAGGIIGTYITAEDVGLIQVNGGFGFLSSYIASLGDSVIDGIVADGYGIRRSTINGGATINNIIARGTGKRLDALSYSGNVRLSEQTKYRGFDPYNGFAFDQTDDLHRFLGTSRAVPKLVSISDSGLIEDDIFVAQRELGRLEAQRITARYPMVTDPVTGQKTRLDYGDMAYPMRISFGNRARSIIVRDRVDGLSFQAGGIDKMMIGGNMSYSQIVSAGRIFRIDAGSLSGTTTISAEGVEGQIDTINTKASLYATIEASVDIITMHIGTDLGSPSVHAGHNFTTLQVNGSILTGARVDVDNTLFNLIIGHDLQAGAAVSADAIQFQRIGGACWAISSSPDAVARGRGGGRGHARGVNLAQETSPRIEIRGLYS